VILWSDVGGYNGYLERRFRDPEHVLPTRPARGCDTPRRYGLRKCFTGIDEDERPPRDRRTRRLLKKHVDLIVIHYDATGTSRRCFEVLHNARGLSAHFLIDLDGTIYQALDVVERARHAGRANDRSVGVELANVGAYEDPEELHARAEILNDGYGVREEWISTASGDCEPVAGVIQGRLVYQFPFTDAQYDALIGLTRALHAAMPGIRLVLPRTPIGAVSTAVMTAKRLAAFRGVLGHYHVSDIKIDPGPAFDWDRFLHGLVSQR